MLAYQPSAPACAMMETTGYYGNDAMDTQGSSSINSVEFGESCLYAAAAAAASIVHQPPPHPPAATYQQQQQQQAPAHPNHLHNHHQQHQLPPFELLNSASLLDGPCGPPAPPAPSTPPPPYVGAPSAFMQQQDLSAMEVKVEPDTLMDEYSPVSSYLVGSTSPSSQSSPLGNNPGRLRKQKEDKTCGVCGDKALGYNFDAISCESCKAFFRRNAPKGLDYFKCPYDEKCKMDVSNRRFCKRCRLKKCFEIGMRKEYILTDEEKARKRQKIEENKYAATTKTPHCVSVDTQAARLMKDLERQNLVHRNEVSSQTRMMSEQDQADIEEVITAYQASLNINMEKDFPREQANSMSDLVNIAELSVRRVIAMAKQMKDFKVLSQTDQIALLKGGSIELLILRSVVSFDKEKQQFLDMNDTESHKALKLEQFKKAENGTGLFEEHMKFVKTLAVDIGADQTTLLLLLVISLYSPDRDNLKEKDHVSAQQERYSMLLQNYLDVVYPYPMARIMLPRLLMKLTDIRNLNEEHSQVLLKVNPEGIQPLMKEVLDMTQ